MSHNIEDIIKNRILVLDGAMGTLIQAYNLSESDYRSDKFNNHEKILSGCHDVLNLTQPHIICEIHEQYLEAGADIIETNSFNANSLSMADYALERYIYDINFQAAQLARKSADKYTAVTSDKPRFVAGSVGPTSKTLSISPDINRPEYRSITFDDLAEAYFTQVLGLIEGGIDIILVETIFDTLNAKAALYAINKVFKKKNIILPIMISGTITDKAGRNLSGQTIEAFLNSFQNVQLLSFGLNCSFGAKDLRPYVARLARISPFNLCIYPNAGLPNELGKYDESPEEMAQHIEEFCAMNWINIIGGCCGTTPKHIKLFSELVKSYNPRIPLPPVKEMKLCGMESIPINKESNFINIGERTNITGSRKFAETIRSGNYKQAVEIAKRQIISGAQIIDICMDDAMINVKECMQTFLNYLASEPDIAKIPVMIDSSDWEVIIAGLKCFQGKGIVNSLSLKDGEDVFIKRASDIKELGAALVVMCFDEKGQADTFKRKIEIAERSYNILIKKVNFPSCDIIIDPNVLAIGTGIREHNNYTFDFIKAAEWIKANLPDVSISGGISNLSFAFRGHDSIRAALHSVFLYHAIKAGMNMGIVNPAQLVLYNDIPEELLNISEDIILNRNENATEKLIEYINKNEDFEIKKDTKQNDWLNLDVIDRLKYALIHGIDNYIEKDIKEAVGKMNNPMDMVEGPLMEAMNHVGGLFGEGKMFLPQVVKTARVMKLAVNSIIPYIKEGSKNKNNSKGKILIATVKGDVHDIGKNIVSVVLSCNNVDVIDLGVMVSADKIVDEAVKNQVDAVALSGLITPSLHEMVFVASEMEKMNLKIPLLIGGAATSKIFTAVKIAPVYSGAVIYVKDASMAARIASQITSANRESFLLENEKENKSIKDNYLNKSNNTIINITEARKLAFKNDHHINDISKPIFIGTKALYNIPFDKIIPLINWTAFLSSWGINGKYPDVLSDIIKGEEASKVYYDANILLSELIEKEYISTEIVFGIYPANATGDDICVYKQANNPAILYMLRAQTKTENQFQYCLSDFLVQKDTGVTDYLGLFLVSVSINNEEKAFYKDEFQKIMIGLLSDRLVEAISDWLFEETMRKYWGRTVESNNKIKYAGIKPAVGYPCYPDHSEKETIFNILDIETHTKVRLTENYAMTPVSSICGLYFSNKKAKYFNVGKVAEDQLTDYARRKNISIVKLKKLLSTNTI